MNRDHIRILITMLALVALLVPTSAAMAQGGPGGGNGGGKGGGGGHTEAVGNNLSFPVIWAEGVKLNMRVYELAEPTLTMPYYDYKIPCGNTDAYAYAQKVEGNLWLAQNDVATDAVIVDEIDWGDSLESVDMKIGRPVRIELSLYKLLDVAMKAYTMVMLANPSSPDEVQGACATDPTDGGSALTYDSLEATVYSPNGRLVIQSLIGDKESIDASDLNWVNDHWVDMDPDDSIGVGNPIQVSFSGELNVGGKVIYGLSQGGWKPTAAGDYRITFYLPTDENTFFDAETTIRVSAETEEITAEAEDTGGGLAYVDSGNNLTYIDISVVAGGGGGGGGGKGKPGADVDVLRPNAGDCECDCECLCLEECIPGQDCECECQCEESCPNCDCAPLEGSAVTNGATHEIYLPLITH